MKKIVLFLVYSFFGFNLCAGPIEKNPDEISSITELSDRIRKKKTDIESISFTLIQNTYIGESTHTITAEVAFKRTQRLRVKYQKPYVQEIIFSDGYLYTYIPRIKQATVQKKDDFSTLLGVTPSIILSTDPFGVLKKNFHLVLSNDRKNILVAATPINKKDFNRMRIWFDQDTYLPVKTVVEADHLRSVTVFKDYRLNPDLEEDFFEFVPEQGVNLIEIQ